MFLKLEMFCYNVVADGKWFLSNISVHAIAMFVGNCVNMDG